MCLKLTVLLLGLSTSLVLARRLQAPLVVDENIRQLHSESLVLAESHQAKSTPCFTIYNPQLNQITNNYEVAYEKCISAYEACSKSIENHYKPARLELESTVSQSCDALSYCNGWSNSYTAFTCASTQAAEDSKNFYALSANATNLAANVKADYVQSNTVKTVCVNNAERTYVEDTTRVYGQLNSCLLGYDIPNPPTTDTTTEYPTTLEYYTTSVTD
ncbi:uncharacterized protein LOC111604269 [Drosophila hydei]|uniref:Uncharacterized protein LOC111604269 n=1 Tax=Drosophila hydei TaxID=7224 RepID=A0A6J1MBR0_DROHY|nr:uncharacterized protein LOC111604269 [Drosophila hydei]